MSKVIRDIIFETRVVVTEENVDDIMCAALEALKMYLKHPLYGCLKQEGQKLVIDTGNIDAECTDMIVQYALFGKIVFG